MTAPLAEEVAREAVYLTINRCPVHGFMAISIECGHHDAPQWKGRRLTPGKCCGRWDRERRWQVSPTQLMADIRETVK
jgi:hypothetical protein